MTHVFQPLAGGFRAPWGALPAVRSFPVMQLDDPIAGRVFGNRHASSFAHAYLSLASLRLAQQTLKTNPEEGAIEYDGTAFYATMSGVRRAITLGDDTMTADVTVANTLTETEIHSSAIAIGEMKAGSMYRLQLFGKFSTANAADSFDMRFKMGGTTLLTATLTPKSATDDHFTAELNITIRTIGAGGTYAAHLEGAFGTQVFLVTPITGSVDTTVAEDLAVTLQWDNNLAGNTFTLMQSLLEVIN